MRYSKVTLQELIETVLSNPKQFPNKLDTVVMTGDFEGNYTHRKHSLFTAGERIVLTYEMHEGQN